MTLAWQEYVKDPACNWSTLRELRLSTLHYEYALKNGRADTPRFAAGRAVHALALEPEFFDDGFAIYEGKTRKGKEWDAFETDNASKTILKRNEFAKVSAVAKVVREHFLVRLYTEKGRAEVSIKWVDKETGIECKARVDWISESMPAFLDLKTSKTADEFKFGSAAAGLGYHGQMAFYRRGLLANGIKADALIVAVEMEAPHDLAVFRVAEHGALAVGDELVTNLLRKLADYRSLGVAGGRYEEERELLLPKWCYPSDDDGLTATLMDDGNEQQEEA